MSDTESKRFSGFGQLLGEGSSPEDTTLNLRVQPRAGVEAVESQPELDNELVRELASTTGELEAEVTIVTSKQGVPQAHEHLTAVAEAATIARQAQVDPLLIVLRREADATASARRAASLLYELGRLLEATPGRELEARQAYQESHQRFPGLTVAARALRALLYRCGEYVECLRVLESEVSAAAETEEKVAILTEMASLRTRHLGDLGGAREDLLRAQKLDPDDPAVLDALADNYRQSGAPAQLEALLHHRARSVEDPALRSAMLCQVARLREEQNDSEGAEALYRTAHNTSPQNLYALQALLRTARANRDYPALARLCESLAGVDSPAGAAAALWEAARTYRDRMRNPGLAITALEQASLVASDDRAVLIDLCDLYEREKRWDDLAATLDRAASLSGDRSESSVLALRLAQVRSSRLHDPDGAIAALRRAVDLSPDNVPARRMLGRLYTRRDRWDELVGLLSEELELYTDPHRRAATAFRIGEIFEARKGEPERALEFLEQALSQQPGFRPAMRAVIRLYNHLGRFEDLVAIYEQSLAFTNDREERIQLLRRISEVWEQKLHDPVAALSSYERLVAIEPSNPQAMRALHRLYAIGNRWSDLVALLKTDADQTMDRWRRVALLVEAAEVQERRLEDTESALHTYLEVLEIAPTHQPALMAAGRILHQLGRHAELLRLHQRELEQTENPEHRIWLLMKIGRLRAEHLDQPLEAAGAYNEAMHLSAQVAGPGGAQYYPAADQLIRIYHRLDRHAEHLALLQKLPAPVSGRALSLQHRRIAEVLQHGQRPALAVEYLRRAVAASDDDAAFQQLARLYVNIGDRQSLAQLYAGELASTADPRGKTSIQHKLAYLWSFSDHDLDRSVEALEQILELDPRNRVVLHQLEIVLGRVESWEKLAAVLELIRYPSEDVDYRLACALLIAALKEDRLDDLQGAAHSAVEVLERHPTHPEALDVLERQYRSAGNGEGLAQVLRRLVKASQNATEQAAFLVGIGSVEANRGQPLLALEALRLASRAMPSYLPAARGWFRAAEACGDGAEMATALHAEAEASTSPERHAECLYQAGQTWHQSCGDQERAIASYRTVLEVDPRHRKSVEALAALFTSRREWDDLVELLRHMVDHAADNQETKATLARLADVLRSRLSDLAAARRTLKQALEIDPNDLALLTTLAELCRTEGDYPGLAEVDHRLVALTQDPVLLKALHFELGLIWEEKMEASAKAIDEYRKVLELDSNDLGALTRLSALLVREEDWIAAARAAELLIQRDDDRNRLKSYHLRLAHIHAKGFRDLKGAMESCRRALALDPGDLEATERLSELLQAARDLRGLNAHLASALTVHRARLERDPFRLDSYQAVLRVFEWQKSTDRMFVARSLMEVLGCASADDRARLAEVQLQAQEPPARGITVEEIEGVLLHADLRGPLRKLLLLAEPVLRKVLPPSEPIAARAEKISSRSSPRLAALLNRLTKTCGGSGLTAYQVDGGLEQLAIDDSGGTAALVLGRRTLEELEDPQVLFAIGRLVARVRLHQQFYTRFDARLLGRAIAALLSCTTQSFVSPYKAAELREFSERLERAMGKRLRRQLEPLSLELSDKPFDPARWQLAMEQTEDRLALAACGDIQAAMHWLLDTESSRRVQGLETPVVLAAVAGPRFRGLLTFALSEEYLTLRERLGLAISG